VDPESRRIVPEANGRTKLKVVYVVLEAQYQASLGSAVNKINTHRKEVRARRLTSSCVLCGGSEMQVLLGRQPSRTCIQQQQHNSAGGRS
jgi:hypothetical protein